jgi:hypothetical protein
VAPSRSKLSVFFPDVEGDAVQEQQLFFLGSNIFHSQEVAVDSWLKSPEGDAVQEQQFFGSSFSQEVAVRMISRANIRVLPPIRL